MYKLKYFIHLFVSSIKIQIIIIRITYRCASFKPDIHNIDTTILLHRFDFFLPTLPAKPVYYQNFNIKLIITVSLNSKYSCLIY